MYGATGGNATAKKGPEELALLAVDELVPVQKEILRFIPERMQNSRG